MLRVIIVEDEVLVRAGIQSTIDWEANGLSVAGVAANGEEGLNLYRNERPDIIITDLRMPGMDGLELIRRIRREDREVKIIVLTCLVDFKYLQESIRLNANEYLVKATMTPEELLGAALRLKEEIEKSRGGSGYREVLREAEKLTRIQAAGDLIFGRYGADTRERLLKQLTDYGILREDCGGLLLFSIDQEAGVEKCGYDAPVSHGSRIYTLRKCVEEAGLCPGIAVVLVDDRNLACLATGLSGEALRAKAAEFIALLRQTQGFSVTAVCAEPEPGRPESYQECLRRCAEILKERIFYPRGAVIDAEDTPAGPDIDMSRFKSFAELAGCAEIVRLREELARLLTDIAASRNRLAALMYFLNHTLRSVEPPQESPPAHVPPLTSFSGMDELAAFILSRIDEAGQKNTGIDYKGHNPFVCRSIQHIREHYAEKIALNELSELCRVNTSYLSRIFHRETGVTVTEFINLVRILRARQLLVNTDMKVYEVAEAVGYSDNNYFSRVFRQYMGNSPLDYRQGKNSAVNG